MSARIAGGCQLQRATPSGGSDEDARPLIVAAPGRRATPSLSHGLTPSDSASARQGQPGRDMERGARCSTLQHSAGLQRQSVPDAHQRRGSVVRTSVCSRRTFRDLRLIHG